LLSQGAVAYGGYSAGICVLGPSLRGLEAVDDPARLRSLHHVEPMWEGLGLLAYRLVPHVDSPEHPETVGCGQVAAGYQAAGIAHRTLRDGEVLVIDGEVERLCTR
jgi:dipeptidase E